MDVRELMTADPEACLPTDSCTMAGKIMRRRQCGFLPVVEDHAAKRVIGVVTDRDIAMYLSSANRSADQVPVTVCMTKAPRTIAPDATLEEAAQAMEQAVVHRLPVVQHGRLVGILSLTDLALAAKQQWAHTGPNVAERQMTEILESIAEAQKRRG